MKPSHLLPFAVLGCAWLLAACGALPSSAGSPPRETTTSAAAGPALTVHDVLAPVLGQPGEELAQLEQIRPASPAAELRRAWLLLESGHGDRAIEALNRVLFGTPAPSVGVEAFALYVRSLAWAKQGDAARAAFDREQAAKLALDGALQARIAADVAAARPAEPARGAAQEAIAAVIPRQRWEPAPLHRGKLVPMGPIYRLTIHHSGMEAGVGSADGAAAEIRAIQRRHMSHNGWGDIGYHYVLDRAGRVYEARPLRWQGAHAGEDRNGTNNNPGNVGICLLGNFVRGRDGQEPTPQQVASLRRLVQTLCARYGIDAEHIYTHRELRVTECPGERLQAIVDRMRHQLGSIAASPAADAAHATFPPQPHGH